MEQSVLSPKIPEELFGPPVKELLKMNPVGGGGQNHPKIVTSHAGCKKTETFSGAGSRKNSQFFCNLRASLIEAN